ncbi:sugar 3,4-ketoisomerase [Pseudomonas sp.]|uniref:sugar 3,4-ketoisomerase n=1 Tax=Pseudomonas sp. TaxID=306 RepID=UPI003FD8EFC7
MSIFSWMDFKVLGDERGQLVALEGNNNIPFDIKRVYYLTGTKPGVPRGFHAHKELDQVAICVTGKCRMIMDSGYEKEEAWLNSSTKGLRIRKMIWHEMHDFSEDCVLMVLASDIYDESDYIRQYSQFVEMVKNA